MIRGEGTVVVTPNDEWAVGVRLGSEEALDRYRASLEAQLVLVRRQLAALDAGQAAVYYQDGRGSRVEVLD